MSKSSVSREFVEASAEQVRALCERRFDDVDLLVIYLDGLVFGTTHPVQRCRNHKVKNVLDYLPKDLRDQVKHTMKAAYRLDADEGIARLKKLAEWLRLEHPSAAESLLEGLPETFIVNRLGLSPALSRCLCTTNLIESPHAGVRLRTRRVSRWRDGRMVLPLGGRRVLGHREEVPSHHGLSGLVDAEGVPG